MSEFERLEEEIARLEAEIAAKVEERRRFITDQIQPLEAEISREAAELRQFRAEERAITARYPPVDITTRYYYIARGAELDRAIRSKRGRLGYLRRLLRRLNREIRSLRAKLGWLKRRLVPRVEAVDLFMYATRGDSKNPYPYVWEIEYVRVSTDYDRLKELLQEHSYWRRYWESRDLKILRVRGGFLYSFKDRPPVYVIDGDVFVPEEETKGTRDRLHIAEHQAALTVSVLNTLGLVEGFHRERRKMTPEEIAEIPRREGP